MKKLSFEEIKQRMAEFFYRRWDEIQMVIDYDSSWEQTFSPTHVAMLRKYNRIDYSMSGLIDFDSVGGMKVGEVAKSMDDYGRKFIIIQTRLGIVVVFVTSKDIKDGDIDFTRAPRLRVAYPNVILKSPEDIAMLIGSPNGISKDNKLVVRNIGEWIEVQTQMLLNQDFAVPHLFIIKDALGNLI